MKSRYLTEGETRVLRCYLTLRSGKRRWKNVAPALGISHKTVATMKNRAMRRLKVTDEIQLAAWLIQNGWVDKDGNYVLDSPAGVM